MNDNHEQLSLLADIEEEQTIRALPIGWCWSTVEGLAAAVPRALTDGPFGSHLKTSHYTDAGPRVIRLQNIGEGVFINAMAHVSSEHFERLRDHEALAGDIVVAMLGEKLPRACVVPDWLGHAIVKADCVRYRVGNGVDSRFAMHILNAPQTRSRAGDLVHGVGRPRLGLKLFRDLPLPVAPSGEQTAIVNVIDEHLSKIDAAIANLKRAQSNLKRYRASVLKAAVEGRLVPTEAELARQEGRDYEPASVLLEGILAERRRRWEEAELVKMKAKGVTPKDDKWKAKYEEPTPPDTEGLPELPEGWCWTTMPALGELSRGKSKHRPRDDARLYGDKWPFIQTGDVRRSVGVIREYSQAYSDFGLNQSRLWPIGTLCITIAANIAETGILSFDACFPDSIVGFRAPGRPQLVSFMQIFVETVRGELERYAPATAQKNINLQILEQLTVPLPPQSEQIRIVNELEQRLSVAVQTEAACTSTLVRCTRLRQSILKWAFEGKLVDQDPNDEPASVLLERIRAEREAATSQPKLRKKKSARKPKKTSKS